MTARLLGYQELRVLARVLPFGIYLSFLALAAGITWLSHYVPALSAWATSVDLWLYPVKTVVVCAALVYFWPRYEELTKKSLGSARELVLAVIVGVLIYFAWVRMTWPWAVQGEPSGYNPFLAGEGMSALLAVIRIFGAAVIIPIMEELFWRSFLLRYLISPDFEKVPLGSFTLFSFLATLVLFGLEHHLWLAGMLAGAAYTLLLYRTGKLWPSIIAHAATNLVLGVHVLLTKEWMWW